MRSRWRSIGRAPASSFSSSLIRVLVTCPLPPECALRSSAQNPPRRQAAVPTDDVPVTGGGRRGRARGRGPATGGSPRRPGPAASEAGGHGAPRPRRGAARGVPPRSGPEQAGSCSLVRGGASRLCRTLRFIRHLPRQLPAAPPWVACHSGWLSGPSRFEALPRPLPPVVTRAPWMSHLRGSEPGRAACPAGGRDRLPRGARARAQQVRSGFVCCLSPVTRHLPV